MTVEANDERGHVVVDPTPEQVVSLVQGLDASNTFATLSRGTAVVQTLRFDADAWLVEYQEGEPWRRYRLDVPSADAVTKVLLAWLADQPGWRETYPWALDGTEGRLESVIRRWRSRRR